MKQTVVVGMSGGVDSSVSAFLLKEAGYNVIGLFMKSWDELNEKGICKASLEYEDVQRVCQQIDIPSYNVNLVEEYRSQVFSAFLADLQNGLTPNPDVLCNREIKFNAFFKKAKALDADFLATGHYCRTDEKHRLLKGSDTNKDQSYFLHMLKSQVLQHVLFPIGHLKKKEVRAIAKKTAMITAQKKDSTGICFIGKRNFKSFLSNYLGYFPGNFLTLSGNIVGRHDGAAFYTIGQRKGLGLGGEGEPWYVVGKEISKNEVYVERGSDHQALFTKELRASQFSWVSSPPSTYPLHCEAKIRYRQESTPAILYHSENGVARVKFQIKQRAVTPGQFIVFYNEDICLGGARIDPD